MSIGMSRRVTVLSAVALFVVYLGLSFLNDDQGFLGTDTGGKVATLRAMDARGDTHPSVGYWAEQWDPDGSIAPMYFTYKIGNGWVNVTTLPALYAALPLYKAFGYRGALVLPMLGGVACALAAAAMVRRLGKPEQTTVAFWVVGLAGPVAIYALDFWEHTIGLACMAWAVVVLFDVVARTRPAWFATGAGLLLGVAATMRTETLVFGGVATALSCLWLVRRHVATALVAGACVAAGLAVPLLANQALERSALDAPLRATRAESTVSSASDAETGTRIEEAALTSLGVGNGPPARQVLWGVAVTAAIAAAVRLRDARLLAIAAALLIVRGLGGLGFVPGLLIAAPVGIAGVAAGWQRVGLRTLALTIGCAALPIVWSVQYTGGAGPQWGGRYILLSSFLFAVVGIVVLADAPDALRRGLIGLGAAVTVFGLVWVQARTHDVARSARALDKEPGLLVSRVAHLVREGGAVHDLDRWLTAVDAAGLREVAVVADATRPAGLSVVDFDGETPPASIGGYRRTGDSHTVRYIRNFHLRVWTYEANAQVPVQSGR